MDGVHPILKPLAVVALVSFALLNADDIRKLGHLKSFGTTVSAENCVSGGFTFKHQCPKGGGQFRKVN